MNKLRHFFLSMGMRMMMLFFTILMLGLGSACSEGDALTTEPVEIAVDTVATSPDTMPAPPEPLHYLALGDSYTIGQSVSYEERYPVQLVRRLQQDSIRMLDPTIIARTGWTTTQLKNAIAEASLRESYDLVSLLIGVNNQYQNKPIDLYRTEFTELLETALRLADRDTSRLFVLSIPDYAYTPFGQSTNPQKISREIDEYNKINQEITEAYGISYFNITPISRQGLSDPDLVASDRLHPSGKMYRLWVELLYRDIRDKLP